MRHWQSVLPLPIHELRYESLVESPETEARRLIGFLGLDWEPACLEFHRSNRAVQTPTRWQARETIHRSSSGRWQRHAHSLPAVDPDSFPTTHPRHTGCSGPSLPAPHFLKSPASAKDE